MSNRTESTTSTEVKRADDFLQLFGQAELLCRQLVHEANDARALASVLADLGEKIPRLRLAAQALDEIRKIRNVIAHPKQVVGRLIPTEETLTRLRELVTQLERHREGINRIPKSPTPVREFGPDDALIVALRYMAEHEFSQIAVRSSKDIELLTAIDISEWLATKIEGDIIQLSDHAISEAIQKEGPSKFRLLSGTAMIGDVEAEFSKAARDEYQALCAVLITTNGTMNEPILRMITSWDLLHLKL
jgi:predicted transcriptional regulator